MPTTPPSEISTADLQKYIPNAQKPIAKPIFSSSHDERKNLILQSIWNVFNAYEGDVCAYKDLAMLCIECLHSFHVNMIESTREDKGYCSDAWVADQRDLVIASCLLRQIHVSDLEPLEASI